MSVEPATGIWNLVPASPAVGDPVAEGANHLRLIKSALQSTLPGIKAPMTTTHTDLNGLAGGAGRLSALEGNRVRNDVAATAAGPLTVSTSVNSPCLMQGGHLLVPGGIIVMWSGSVATVPAGWNLCDGTNGTPNLQGYFVLSASPTIPPWTTGGAAGSSSNSGIGGIHNHTGATVNAGGHAHTNYTGAVSLTTDQIPSHSHGVTDPQHSHGMIGPAAAVKGTGGTADFDAQAGTTTSPAPTNIIIQNTGGGNVHSHSISYDGDHVHTVTVDPGHAHLVTVPTIPPYFALCFIMKL